MSQRGFHLSNGVYFDSDEEGNVTIRHELEDESTFEISASPTEWASVIASVSKRGETADTFQEARRFHEED